MRNRTTRRWRAGPQNPTTPHRSTARVVAFRLWPPPDPVNYAKREAVELIAAHDAALRVAGELSARAVRILFKDLDQLWIHPTRVEALLALELLNVDLAARHLGGALEILRSARVENDLRNLDERARERHERKAGHE